VVCRGLMRSWMDLVRDKARNVKESGEQGDKEQQAPACAKTLLSVEHIA